MDRNVMSQRCSVDFRRGWGLVNGIRVLSDSGSGDFLPVCSHTQGVMPSL